MLKQEDKIFKNLYGFDDWQLKGAKERGIWSNTKDLIKLGSDPNLHHGSLSDPVYKTSTIIFNDYKSFLDAKKNKFKKPYYGRFGNYSVKRFEELICQLYKSQGAIITSSGLSAITISLLSIKLTN